MVNNAVVLVQHIEIERNLGLPLRDTIPSTARLRPRPIQTTTPTTVVGMLPPAITIVSGPTFSTPVSLLLVSVMYLGLARR